MNDHSLELRQRRIPPGLHYVSAEQSDLWRALAAAHSPAGDDSVRAAYAELFATVGEEMAGKALQLITLGAGSGEKESELVAALNAEGCSLRISAVDVSESLAAETANRLDGGARAVVGDFLNLDPAVDIVGEEPRLFTAFGLSPNTRPGEFFRALAHLLRPDDRALISANLWPDAEKAGAFSEVLAQYDNAETCRWLWRLFKEWGMTDEQCPGLDFSIGDIEGVAAVIATAQWLDLPSRNWSESAPDEIREWLAGERIEVFCSLRYTVENFSGQAQGAGLSVRHSVTSQCGREAVFSVSHSPETPLSA